MSNPYWAQVRPIIRGSNWAKHCRTLAEREKFCEQFAWAIPDPKSLDFVAKQLGDRAVEMGAGTGYWAAQLALHGVRVDAYDMRPRPIYYPVCTGAPVVLQRYDMPLLLCWPPYHDPMAADCLRHYRGKTLVYIGCVGAENGCNADNVFWQRLKQDWRMIATHAIERWYGCYDRIVVYQRRGRDE